MKDNQAGIVAGIVGGVYKYLMQIHVDAGFGEKLTQAIIIALASGAAGYIGKRVIEKVIASVKKRMNK